MGFSRLAIASIAIASLAPLASAGSIQWDAQRQAPRNIRFQAEEAPRFAGSAATVARRFLDSQRNLFNGVGAEVGSTLRTLSQSFLGLDPLAQPAADRGEAPLTRISRVDEGRDISFVRMQQVLDGLDVAGADVVVAVRRDGSISSLQGGYVAAAHDRGRRTLLHNAVIAGADAAAGVIADLGVPADAVQSQERLVWWADKDGRLVKAYEVDVMSRQPLGEWKAYVEAHSGHILEVSETLLAAHEDEAHSEATGKGKVYMTNPLRDSSLQEVDLPNLSGNGSLTGSFVKVSNGKQGEIQAGDHDFRVEPDSTHFGEVMLYYHIDKIHGNLKSIDPDFAGMDWRIPVEVHSKGSFFMRNDNAYYSPAQKALFILDPSKLNDLHLEAAVAYHEYHHAVTDNIVPGLSSAEGRAMHEGYSDYFACRLTNDPEIGEWALKPINRPNMRDLETTRTYPDDLVNKPHQDGEIWAAGCWTLAKTIDPAKADFLVHKSRSYLSGNASFNDAYQGMLQADQDFLGGQYAEKITEVFTARGIAQSGEGDDAGQQARFRALFRE